MNNLLDNQVFLFSEVRYRIMRAWVHWNCSFSHKLINMIYQLWVDVRLSIYTGCPKSHFTLLKANKSKPNRAKKIGYISNEKPDMGVFLGIYYFISTRWSNIARGKRNHGKNILKNIEFFFSPKFWIFFFKTVQIYMKDSESAESK